MNRRIENPTTCNIFLILMIINRFIERVAIKLTRNMCVCVCLLKNNCSQITFQFTFLFRRSRSFLTESLLYMSDRVAECVTECVCIYGFIILLFLSLSVSHSFHPLLMVTHRYILFIYYTIYKSYITLIYTIPSVTFGANRKYQKSWRTVATETVSTVA